MRFVSVLSQEDNQYCWHLQRHQAKGNTCKSDKLKSCLSRYGGGFYSPYIMSVKRKNSAQSCRDNEKLFMMLHQRGPLPLRGLNDAWN